MKCWANELGNCSEKMSLEHYVSKGVFSDLKIKVQGFSWCLNEPKKISLAKLGTKILCTKHNNELGEVIDLEGIRLFKFIKDISGSERTLELNGYDFEKWMLKTAINLTVHSNEKLGIGMVYKEGNNTCTYFQHVLFGLTKLDYDMGMYLLPNDTHIKCQHNDFVKIIPISKNKEIGAVYFNIQGLGLVLALFPNHSLPILKSIGINNNIALDHVDAKPIYRPRELEIQSGHIVKKIILNWK